MCLMHLDVEADKAWTAGLRGGAEVQSSRNPPGTTRLSLPPSTGEGERSLHNPCICLGSPPNVSGNLFCLDSTS